MDIDDVYIQIGEFGWQQKIYFFVLSLFNFYAPLHLVQYIFTARAPTFTCFTKDETYNNTCGPTNQISACDKIIFEDRPDSLVIDWKLVCSDNYKARMVQSIFMAGVLFGALILGPITDKIGRRRMLALTLLALIVTGIGSSFIKNYTGYVIMRFINGFACAGNILSSFVLGMELIGPSKRGLCGNIFQIFFALGIMAYSLFAWLIPQWRILTFLVSSIGILGFFIFIIIPESPRWYLNKHRSREAREVLKTIAKRNNMLFPSNLEISTPLPNVKEGTLLCLFKRRNTCICTAIQLYSWFVNSAVYYGLTLASDQLGDNLYISTMLSGLVEIPAYIFTALILDRVGRKLPLSFFMITGAVSCLTIQFFSEIPSLVMTMALIGKLSIAASFAIIYIHSAEIFPTVVRNGGLGLCSCFARIGGICAPFFSAINVISPSLQFTLFGILSLTSGLLNLYLPETLNKTLPETLEEYCAANESVMRNERGRNYARIDSLNENDLSDDEIEEYSGIPTDT